MKDEFSITKLQKEIKKRIKQASDALLNDDKKTARENLEWVDISDKLIDKYKKKPNKIKLSILIGSAAVLLISLGIGIKLPKTNISLDATITSVTLALGTSEWDIDNRFSASGLTIDNLKKVEASFVKIEHPQPFSIDLKGNKITMDHINLSPKSIITMQIEDSNKYFFILKNDSLNTRIQISQARLNINDGELDTIVNYPKTEIVNIESFPSTPINIAFSDTNNWSLRDIPVSEINFLEESPPGSGKFNSSILSGKIKILEIDKEYLIQQGDWLNLKHIKCRRIEISKIRNLIKIHIEGEVDEASTGAELFEQKLNPSIAEYLYYAKSFAFFWSCIIFMWSLLWSIKNSIFTKG